MRHSLSPWRTALSAATAIGAINLAVLGLGSLLGANMQVARSAGAAVTEVGIGAVVLMSVVPPMLGGLVLSLAGRRSLRTWRGVGWLGLALGVLTLPMPLTVVASSGTSTTLATMHLVAGVAWFTAVDRAAARATRPAAEHAHSELRTAP